MDIKKRTSIWTELKPFCHFSKDSSFLEVTEWSNGEGVDVMIAGVDGNERISMTQGQFDALASVMKHIRGINNEQ